jgi:hypothetical protein
MQMNQFLCHGNQTMQHHAQQVVIGVAIKVQAAQKQLL